MDALTRLQALLADLFQLDTADLDFGLYRLLHIKRREVEGFIHEQLPASVRRAFGEMAEGEQAELRGEMKDLAAQIRREVEGEDPFLPDGSLREEYRQLRIRSLREAMGRYDVVREELQQVHASEAQQIEVFNHLYAFFHRYYEDGDFVPKRRYGSHETYAVPYDGEEVLLHWANKGQHYVKTGERLRDYSFTVETLGGPYRVRFTLAEATTPRENTKGETRFFFPQPTDATYSDGTFVLPFEYRLPTVDEVAQYGSNAKGQEAVLQETLESILGAVPEDALAVALRATVRETDKGEVSLLAHRLQHFARKQTSDYFVHRDLRRFLTRELEFYIKDQVLHVADIQGDLAPKLRLLRVFRRVACDVIDFLDQLERVQCRLFEKKKFVLRTDYLCPIQHVPQEMWPEVLANEHQQAAWRALFGVQDKVDKAFLLAHPTLVVDTSHFAGGFRLRLLESFDDLEEVTDGVLVHGENYQALNLLQARYRGQVTCEYIDPPYNTGDSEIPYKNGYKNSSWLALMHERVLLSEPLLAADEPVVFIAIDDFEMVDLAAMLDDGLPHFRREMIVVNHHPQGGKGKTLANTHEYMIVLVGGNTNITLTGRTVNSDAEHRPFKRSGTAASNFRYARQNSFYAILVDTESLEVVGLEPPPGDGQEYPLGRTKEGWLRVYPLGTDGSERVWRRSYESCLPLAHAGKLLCSSNYTVYQVIESADRTPALFSNWVGPRYNAGTHGANLLRDIIGTHNPFSYPKSLYTVEDALWAVDHNPESALVLDYFAGSGTTGHATIELNREDGYRRRFVLVEMGEYFDSVLAPRIQKVMYCPEWKSGLPVGYPESSMEGMWPEWVSRTPRLVKVLRLEGYEDSLHNLTTEETLAAEAPRAQAYQQTIGPEAYRLHYLATIPLEASGTLLDVDKLAHPFAYTLEVLTDEGPRTSPVDLVETFSLLYGLRVKRLQVWRNPADDDREYRALTGHRGKEETLVIWRDMTGLDPAVERAFLEGRIEGYDRVLINGDSAVPGIESLDPLFKRLMEAGES